MWEYHTFAAAPDQLNEQLNVLAAEGWELIIVQPEVWNRSSVLSPQVGPNEGWAVIRYCAVLKRVANQPKREAPLVSPGNV